MSIEFPRVRPKTVDLLCSRFSRFPVYGAAVMNPSYSARQTQDRVFKFRLAIRENILNSLPNVKVRFRIPESVNDPSCKVKLTLNNKEKTDDMIRVRRMKQYVLYTKKKKKMSSLLIN